MTPTADDPPQVATANLTLRGDGFQLQAKVQVPVGPTRVGDLLPLARALSDTVVGQTCQALEEAGATISCKAGCGACCDNLVAVAEVEARRIGVVVENLPEPRRSDIRARFADARARLVAAGLLAVLQRSDRWTEEEYAALVGDYFRQAIHCPFLEGGSCSIYDERPITCREYLVTSPAEYCARPGSEGVVRVRIPLPVFNAVARWQTPQLDGRLERVVPLILAPEWAVAHPDDPPPQMGVDLLREFLAHLSEKRDAATGES